MDGWMKMDELMQGSSKATIWAALGAPPGGLIAMHMVLEVVQVCARVGRTSAVFVLLIQKDRTQQRHYIRCNTEDMSTRARHAIAAYCNGRSRRITLLRPNVVIFFM